MTAWITISICVVTAVVTQIAFSKPDLLQRLLFRPDAILVHKQWDRLFSSALVHADWMHAGFNLFALYSFGSSLELIYGWKTLVVIYAFSVLGGSLLSLYLHRYQSYSALGASGGVCGVIFASVFLVPGVGIQVFFIPITIPGNLFAIVYLIGTFWALRKGVGKIGHDAHFGGATAGLIFAFSIRPDLCLADPLYFWGSALFALTCLGILYLDPTGKNGKILPSGVSDKARSEHYTGDVRYDGMIADREEQREIDRILEKIASQGADSLNDYERGKLEERALRNRKR